jgi:hypothetical protein
MMDMNQGMNPYGTPMPSSMVGAGGDFMAQLQQWFQQQQQGQQGAAQPGVMTGGQIAGPVIPLSAGASPAPGGMPAGANVGMSPQQMQQVAGGGGGMPSGPALQQIMQQIMGGGGQMGPSGAPGFGATTKPASFDPNAVPGGQFASSGGSTPGSGAGSWMNAMPGASAQSNKMQAF